MELTNITVEETGLRSLCYLNSYLRNVVRLEKEFKHVSYCAVSGSKLRVDPGPLVQLTSSLFGVLS